MPMASSPTWFERCLYNVKIKINSDVREKRAVEGASPYIVCAMFIQCEKQHK